MNDPAVTASKEIARQLAHCRVDPLGFVQIIRDAYATTLAAKDAEIKDLKMHVEVSEMMRGDAVEALALMDKFDGNCDLWAEMKRQRDSAIADRDRLAAEVERLKRMAGNVEMVADSFNCDVAEQAQRLKLENRNQVARIVELEQQVEELRRDAERYRWLRNSSWEVRRYYHTMLQSASVGNLDQAIDAARKETT